MLALLQSFEAGDLAGAQGWHRKLFPLCRDMLGLADRARIIDLFETVMKGDPGAAGQDGASYELVEARTQIAPYTYPLFETLITRKT